MPKEKFDISKEQLQPLRGIVKEILFYKEETGYSVIVLETPEETVNVAGSLPLIYKGASICAYGVWYQHPKYGRQFTCSHYETKAVYNKETAFNYLSSGVIRGVGIATARKIVERFKDETFDIIENDYDRLVDVNGITPQKARLIHDEYVRKNEYQAILTFFASYKIPPDIALKAYNVFGVMTIPIIKKNPYILWEKIEKIHFFYVDKLAHQLGFGYESPQRVEAGIIYVLNHQALNGHTCYPYSELIGEVMKLIHISEKKAENGIMRLLSQKKIVYRNMYAESFLMLPCYYDAEMYIAKRTKMLSQRKYSDCVNIEEVIKKTKLPLSKIQKEAVKKVFETGLNIITGGPGTGKTAIIKTIVECAKEFGKKVIITAPTGRGAKRASELSDKDASTIHRLLEVTGDSDNGADFAKNEKNPLDCDILIADEMSMTDVLLFKALLCALKDRTRVVLIGDVNQLPPVGAGNVLKDLIMSGEIPNIVLDRIYRQNKNSLIIQNAHSILRGDNELIYNEENSDFFIMNTISSNDAYKKIKELIKTRLPEYLKISPSEIQVITPLKKSVIGSITLNRIIKEELNPIKEDEPYKTHGNYVYSVGDRVMQIRNDYDIKWENFNGEAGCGIYNGDMGVITGINLKEGSMTILFDDDKEVIYEFAKLENLELSYAITVHKSQGSEFDAVILPFIFQSEFMNRNLLYTAITRAKKFVCILGKRQVINGMIANRTVSKRHTFLAEFFKENKERQ